MRRSSNRRPCVKIDPSTRRYGWTLSFVSVFCGQEKFRKGVRGSIVLLLSFESVLLRLSSDTVGTWSACPSLVLEGGFGRAATKTRLGIVLSKLGASARSNLVVHRHLTCFQLLAHLSFPFSQPCAGRCFVSHATTIVPFSCLRVSCSSQDNKTLSIGSELIDHYLRRGRRFRLKPIRAGPGSFHLCRRSIQPYCGANFCT